MRRDDKLPAGFNMRTLAHAMYLRMSTTIDEQCAKLQPGQTLAVCSEYSAVHDEYKVHLRFKVYEGIGPYDLGPGDWTLYRRVKLTPTNVADHLVPEE